ncbi:CaiB/BaiF CoA transferase family protein [Pseudoteredinibacter isoporae]|uniref:Crotonobetainyl-CoA:carnitine CoA-transferase CaiB-like acyl-CoA transferase n=1 Tax=Pseudoteredinibacter isoporae TaxID=570281 RepID=A0A7X0JUS9_9GAMM|nr:CoA transferase [Pseudoteredinibacter isoporae]MBB6522672.1 crotonobetainyl-CoA:carnitine CoA-transferase CaiB-like acyl-CoA transferase [Pseudoteredinibacter isoporae]NHO88203.1 CoA transferase [Pseudoteredinibacter isoporae]NIB23466.1 CoA transferase [Pseudoteredinibacter isoporae]
MSVNKHQKQCETSKGPLSGIKIIDCTTVIAGPLCTQILADQGAEVIKIEPLEGDLIRNLGPILAPGLSATFLSLSRNKKSLALDLSKRESQELIAKLCQDADVFICNSRPGVMARHGLDFEALKQHNAKLVYAAITGFGDSGPMAEQRAYDPIIQALSGMASLQEPTQLLGQTICDKTTGLTACQAVTAALLQAERSGQGQQVEISMLEAAIGFLACDAFWPIAAAGRELNYPDFKRVYIPWKTQDGEIVLVILADKEFAGLTEEFQVQHLLEDPRFNSMPNRFAHWDELVDTLKPVFLTQSSEDILKRLWRADVPAAPINTMEQLTTDKQVLASGMIDYSEHSIAGQYTRVAMAANFSLQDNIPYQEAPSLGQHSHEVLTHAGLDEDEIHSLIQNDICR